VPITPSAASALEAILLIRHEQLQTWARKGRLLAAAQEALMLQGTPKRSEQPIKEWVAGDDFRNTPEILLCPAADMNGDMGAYAISAEKICLNQDWLLAALAAQVISSPSGAK